MPIRPFNRRELLKAGLGGAVALGASGLGALTNLANAASPDISHGPRDKAQVALTFHGNGDIALAHKLLAILNDRKVAVTVFAVGTWLKANPTIAKTILAAGHDIGNHTYSHTQMKTISAAKVNSEISLCAKELTAQIGNHGSFFRPSGTQNSTALIRNTALKYGYKKCISYDVDSLDYQDPGKATVLKAVMNNVQNGSIISLHFGHQDTIDAMPTLLDQLQAKGLTPVTLTTMLGKI
jgi:peptidoglycan/xylan/chitin deacetylase (PgdA/CDA1 family)